MKDRLVELCNQKISTMTFNNSDHWFDFYERISDIADHLLANGAIVPPVSIGDSLWDIHYNKPREWKVVYLGFNGEEWHINVHWYKDKDHFCTKEIDGKYVDRLFFRTKEEAERALKGVRKYE